LEFLVPKYTIWQPCFYVCAEKLLFFPQLSEWTDLVPITVD
jgi:hypothetical protein